jgi:hypothetical protein
VESATEVVVRVSVWSEEGMCTADMAYEQHAVTLKAPLQARRLLGCEPGDAGADCLEVIRVP